MRRPGKLTVARARQVTIEGWKRPVKQHALRAHGSRSAAPAASGTVQCAGGPVARWRCARACAELSEQSQDATSCRYSSKACGAWSIAAMTRQGIAVVNGTGKRLAAAHRGQGAHAAGSARRVAHRRQHRHRAHALGHARRAERAQCASACFARRPRGGAQRHHREPRGAARRAARRRATSSLPRPTPRSSRIASTSTWGRWATCSRPCAPQSRNWKAPMRWWC